MNPFILGIANGRDFCDRLKEREELLTYGRNCQNVVLCGKRKIGKSSLVTEVQRTLQEEGFLTIYADLFPVSSEHDLVSTIASAAVKSIGRDVSDQRTFKEKVGDIFSRIIPAFEIRDNAVKIQIKLERGAKLEVLLNDLMEGIHVYVERHALKAHIVLDEFQEITELATSKKIEGTLRSFMQRSQNIGYVYVGSRRRILLDMFNNKSRPFYKSAFMITIDTIPREDFAAYLIGKFRESDKQCDAEYALTIYDTACGYPYYVQKLASLAWGLTDETCSHKEIQQAFEVLLKMESIDFEGIWSGLFMVQKAVLKALATDPTSAPFSKEYLSTHNLSSGSVQRAIAALTQRDLIERNENGVYSLTDPIMSVWLKGKIDMLEGP